MTVFQSPVIDTVELSELFSLIDRINMTDSSNYHSNLTSIVACNLTLAKPLHSIITKPTRLLTVCLPHTTPTTTNHKPQTERSPPNASPATTFHGTL